MHPCTGLVEGASRNKTSDEDELGQSGCLRACRITLGKNNVKPPKLGFAGQKLVLDYEKRRLSEAGREDLAARVRHVAVEEGDGAGYDIQSFTDDGAIRHIEVKTTSGPAETDFFITENELEFARENERTYSLYRVYD